MPENRIHQQQQNGGCPSPNREHSLSKRKSRREAQSAHEQRNHNKTAFSVMEKEVDHTAEQDKERIARRLWLVNPGIELFERKGEVDIVDGQVRCHRRKAS